MISVQGCQRNKTLALAWNNTIDCYIEKIYQSAFSVPPNKFQEWALDEFQRVVPFDAALWGRGSNAHWNYDSLSRLGAPEALLHELKQCQKTVPLVQTVLVYPEGIGDMHSTIPNSIFFISKLDELRSKRLHIRRFVSSEYSDEKNDGHYTLTLYRKNSERIFSDQDRQYQRQAAFHLLNATSLAWLLHSTSAYLKQPSGLAMAIATSFGTYSEVHPCFSEILEKHFPNHRSNTLPFPIPCKGKTSVINGLCVRYEPQLEFSFIFIWPESALDRLTSREREVVNAIAHGLSFKKAAQNLGISPSSAANHLYRIYTKLGVSSRSQLAELVHSTRCHS